ncbi:MAG: hypothetical protein RLZZ192_269, partial [Pseudomonadota bacterium]
MFDVGNLVRRHQGWRMPNPGDTHSACVRIPTQHLRK